MEDSKVYISQPKINYMVKKLIWQIRASEHTYTKIVGIKNGGLFISKEIAKQLHLPHEEIHISCYNRPSPLIRNISFIIPSNKLVLVVDDLIDSSRTIDTFVVYFYKQICAENNFAKAISNTPSLHANSKFHTAVLFWKPGNYKPTYYVEKKPDAWVVFPWEKQ